MSAGSSEREVTLGSVRRVRRESRVVFSLSRGSVWLLGAGLLGSWALAFGLGRRAPAEPGAAPAAAVAPAAPAVRALRSEPPAPPAPATPTPALEASPSREADTASAAPARVDFRETTPADGFGIQIGAYRDRAEAEAAVAALAAELEGLEVYLIPVEIPGKGTWLRVRLGHFRSRQAAEDRKKELSIGTGALSLPYK